MPPAPPEPPPAPAPDAVGPGRQLGDFRLLNEIGSGGMGRVFLAQQLSLDRLAAVKIISPRRTTDAEHVARFLREVRYTAQLEHPGIATALTAGCEGGVHYLAMEYVPGETLDERVNRLGPLPEADALRIGRAVADVLDYAWRKAHILHRDVKPGNIMLTPDGCIKVMDLGLALAADELDPDRRSATPSLGTPQYMSPEHIRRDTALDFRADVYSLGATLHFALTGQRPYPGATPREAVNLHCYGPVPDPAAANPALRAECAQRVRRLMSKDPASRAASWQEVLDDLDRLLAADANTSADTGPAPQPAPAAPPPGTPAAPAAAAAARAADGPPPPPPPTGRPWRPRWPVAVRRTLTNPRRSLLTVVALLLALFALLLLLYAALASRLHP